MYQYHPISPHSMANIPPYPYHKSWANYPEELGIKLQKQPTMMRRVPIHWD